MSTQTEIETGIPPYPFPGLRPFGHNESSLFFGRDEQIDELLCMLEDNRFLAVVGPSGCGKSSLVRAGMIPALEAGFMASAGFRWNTVVMRPGNQPLQSLASALVDGSIVESNGSSDKATIAFLRATLRRGPLGLVEALQETNIGHGQNLLLVVDQFEEIFRFEKQGDSNEARAFVDMLLASSQTREIPIYVVITMRSDFLGNCPVFSGLPEAMNGSQFLTPRLTREQNRLSIECPVSLYDAKIDDAVVSRILNEMGTDPDQLPLMQHLLMRMWRNALKRSLGVKFNEAGTLTMTDHHTSPNAQFGKNVVLTLEDYHQAGGLRGALSGHVQLTYNRVGSAQKRHIAEMMFRRLTDVTSEGQVVRRFASIAEIAKSASVDDAEVKKIVNAFRLEGRSFLMPSVTEVPELSSNTQIDISHESLIRQWEQLSEWTEDEARTSRIRQELCNRALDWEEKDRDDNYLLTGVRLAEAQNWAEIHAGDVQPVEREFLDESMAYRDREMRRKLRNYALVGIFSIAVAVMSIVLLFMAIAARNDAVVEQRKAVIAQEMAERETRISRAHELVAAATKFRDVNPEVSLLLAVESVQETRRHDEPIVKPAERILRELLSHPQSKRNLTGHGANVVSLAISPNGEWLVTGSFDQTARLWDLTRLDEDVKPVVLDHGERVYGTVFSPDSKRLFTSSDDGYVRIWNLDAENQVVLETALYLNEEVRAIAISRNGDWLAAGTEKGNAFVWNLNAPQIDQSQRQLLGHDKKISSVKFSSDGRWLVTASFDKTARVWDLRSPDPSGSGIVLRGHQDAVSSIAINADRGFLVTASYDGAAKLWELKSIESKISDGQDASGIFGKDIIQHQDRIYSVAISPDGNWVATASKDKMVGLLGLNSNVDAESEARYLRGHQYEVLSVVFSPDSSSLVTGSMDSSARVWDVRRDNPEFGAVVLKGHENGIPSIDVNKNWIVTCSYDKTARIWDRASLNLPRVSQIVASHDNLKSMAVDSGGRWLATGSYDNTARLWDLSASQPLESVRTMSGHVDWVNDVAISNNNRWLVTASDDGTARLWDLAVEDRSEESISLNHSGWVRQARFSPDNRWLATFADDNSVRVWDLHAKIESDSPTYVRNHESAVSVIAFSPDSRWLAVGEGALHIWDMNSDQPGKSAIQLPGHAGEIADVVFQPDSKRVFTASHDSTARIWEFLADSSSNSIVLRGHQGRVLSIAVSSDGKYLATGSDDETVRVWTLNARDANGNPIDPGENPVVLPDHTEQATGIKFCNDNRRLVSIAMDDVVRVWDLESDYPGADPVLLRGHSEVLSTLAINDQGLIVTADSDGIVRRWHIGIDQMLELARNCVGRNLTEREFNKFLTDETEYRKTFDDKPAHESILVPAQVLAKNGYINESIALLRKIRKLDKNLVSDPSTYAHRYCAIGLVERGIEAARKGTENDIAQAVKRFQEAKSNDSDLDFDPQQKATSVAAESLLQLGRDLAIRGEANAARFTLQQAVDNGVEIDPENEVARLAPPAIIEKGRDFAFQYQFDQARELFEEASQLGHDIDPVKELAEIAVPRLVGRGWEFAWAGKIDSAVEQFRQAEKLDPGLFRSHLNESQLDSGSDLDIEKLAKQHRFAALIQEGEEHAIAGELDLATESFKNARQLGVEKLSDEPQQYAEQVHNSHQAHERLDAGEEAARNGDTETAVSLFKEAIDFDIELKETLDPDNDAVRLAAEAHVYRARDCLFESRFDDATTEYGQLLNLNTDSAQFDPQRESQFVLEFIEREISSGNSDNARILHQIAKNIDSQVKFDFEEVERELRARRLMDEGRTLAGKGLVDEATAKFQQARNADSDLNLDPVVFARLLAAPFLIEQGKSLAANQNMEEATQKFEKAKQFDPSLMFNVGTYANRMAGVNQRIETLADNGDVVGAIDLYRRVREVDPSETISNKTINNLVWFAGLDGHSTDVALLAEQLVMLDPTDGNSYDTRGLVRALSGHNVEGVISDFETFIAWPEALAEDVIIRKEWIVQLRSGMDVDEIFSEKVLKELR